MGSQRLSELIEHADPRIRKRLASAIFSVRNAVAPLARVGVLRFVRWPLADSAALPVPEGFTCRELRPEELAGAAAAFARPAGTFHRRWLLGDRCFASFEGERIVNLRWAATRPIEIPELDLFFCPSSEIVYFYAAMTLPAFRNRGAAAVTSRTMEGTFLDEGRAWGHAYVSFDNLPSVKTRRPFHEVLFDLGYLRPRGGAVRVFGGYRPPVYREADIPAPAAVGSPRHRGIG